MLSLILFFTMLFVILLAAASYYAERLAYNPDNTFSDIFIGYSHCRIIVEDNEDRHGHGFGRGGGVF